MTFLVLGEALVDLVAEPGTWRFGVVPGGSPLNVAVGLAAADQPVRLASRVGTDLYGDLVRAHLRRHGVDPRDLQVTAEPTSLAIGRLGPDGAARYEFQGQPGQLGQVGLDRADWLHVGSLAALLEPGASAVQDAVAQANRRGVPVSYDPNLRPSLLGTREQTRPAVERLVAAASVVKASEEDLTWLYPDTAPRLTAQRWARLGPPLVIVTRGPAGAIAWHRGRWLACAAPAVAVVDTIGAGDGFTAGLLAALARRADVPEALRWATATGAAVCLRRGAGPADPATVASLVRAIPQP